MRPMPSDGPFTKEEWGGICGEATALLQTLLRIDTTNPPGNEIAAARALAQSLEADGLRTEIIEAAPGRANLVCRFSGAPGGAAPLLLASHLDVVPAGDLSRWTHPPFDGKLADGMIWGRGALDMKNMVAMSAMVLKLLARRGLSLRRDVILAAVADEEEGCHSGSRFLVEEHPDKVRAEFGLGEVGGFPQLMGDVLFMPVQTAEKGICWLRATARGEAGHGSIPRPDSAIHRLAEALATLRCRRLPQHNTPVVEAFLKASGRLQSFPQKLGAALLLNRRLSPLVVDHLMPEGDQSRVVEALLRNTVSPTVLRAGDKINRIPGEATVELDGRLLPGQTGEDLLRELREITGNTLEYEILRQEVGVVNHPPESPLWDSIQRVVKRHRPSLPVLPFMTPGFTDAQQFSRLGIRWYGFAPLWVDPAQGFRVTDLYHGFDERIPEDGFHWGLEVLYDVVTDFCGKAPAS